LLGHLIKPHPSGAGRARGFKRWLDSRSGARPTQQLELPGESCHYADDDE
jgi:hypothetical protein